MYYIIIPGDVTLETILGQRIDQIQNQEGKVVAKEDGGIKVRFKDFLLGWLSEKDFLASLHTIAVGAELRKAIKDATSIIALEDEQYELLRGVFKRADEDNELLQRQIPPSLGAHNYVTFIAAVVGASKEKPKTAEIEIPSFPANGSHAVSP